MESLHIDITAISAMLMGGLLLLIPIAGLTLRFAVDPILQSILRIRESRASEARNARALEERLEAVEEKLATIAGLMERMAAEREAAGAEFATFGR